MSSDLPIVYTFGCRMNAYESEVIRKIMQNYRMYDFIIVNSCAITAEGERQVRQQVRKLHREHPNLHLLITGCSSQFHTSIFLQMEEVDFVIGNEFKLEKKTYDLINKFYNGEKTKKEVQEQILTQNKENIPENNFDCDFPIIDNFEDKTRAFVPVQTGCNHFCAFCVVPFTRGKFKTFPAEQIIKQVNNFVKNDNKEVVLTGIDITDYGKEIRGQTEIDTLGKLCKNILKNTKLERLRLSSVDVAEIDEDIMDLIKHEPRFMPYFHISLQSGSNSVLKRMRRRHTYADVIKFCHNVSKYRPDACFGADIITGFPGETEEEFLQSVEIVKNAPITFIHAFPYSRRERTLAYLMDDNVPKSVKKERVNELIKLGEENLQKAYKKLDGTMQNILIERNSKGRCENFLQVYFNNDKHNEKTAGDIFKTRVKFKNGKLFTE